MGAIEETLDVVEKTSRVRIFWDAEEVFGVSLPSEEKPKTSAELGELLKDLSDFLAPGIAISEADEKVSN